ncbi:MAG TPA: ABC transporter ATP-binding protein, partial [Patescibacteria group bacterium]|nr:ABC transporter ATP-binding protein [Patescibacteria group bacterium]
MPLLEIKNLRLDFGQGDTALRALDDVSLSLEAGQTLCLVGESGCGKSATALSIARLLPSPPARYCGGSILLDGKDVLQMSAEELRLIRGRTVAYVFQEPSAALNPVHRIGRQIREALRVHRPQSAADTEVIRLLKTVRIPAPESRLRCYPQELSGGMQQRVMLAMALASQPRLLVADEPTTALDVTIQAQIIDLMRDLQEQFSMAILLITHNLGIVGDLADRAAVMYAGQIVEFGPVPALLRDPLHPYTRALIASIPVLGAGSQRLISIPGAVPRLGAWPAGCRFHPRCSQAQHDCSEQEFGLAQVDSQRRV